MNASGVTALDQVGTVETNGSARAYGREYAYDFAGRLTRVDDATTVVGDDGEVAATCTTRAYSFDANSRRTALASTDRAEGDCTQAGTTTTVGTSGWDAADRPTTGQGGQGRYTYDAMGRQTSIPAADAPDSSRGAITLGYFDDDLPRTVTQGGTSTTFTLDAAGRRATQTTTAPGASGVAETTTTVRRYTDDSDNPAWTDTTTPTGTSTTRFVEGLGGDLTASINADGGITLPLANPHGDTVTDIDIPAAQHATTPAVAITGWASYAEYGTPTTTTPPPGGQG